jgi:hypothetical protein
LKRDNERLRAKVHKLEAPDEVRRDYEHWYEVTEYFDASEIKRLPVDGGEAYIMGKLDDVTIVEVAKKTPMDVVKRLGEWLKENGIDALLVSEGVKFMKLKPASEDQAAQLDRYEQTKREAEAEIEDAEFEEPEPDPEAEAEAAAEAAAEDPEFEEPEPDPEAEAEAAAEAEIEEPEFEEPESARA